MTSEALVTIWLISALVGTVVGQSRGRTGPGFALGALLGVIGVVIIALLSKTPQKQAEDLGLARDPLGVLMVPLQLSASDDATARVPDGIRDSSAGDSDRPPESLKTKPPTRYAWMRSEPGSNSGRRDGRAGTATPATSIE